MNAEQMQELGLALGSEIVILSNRGWAGWYTVGDTGCNHGIIDIFVAPGNIPWYGVEDGVQILIV
jgi:hypothetical protein